MAGERILVVDDDASIATLVAEVLGDEGLQVVAVNNAREAAAQIRDAIPHLVLLDVNLPGRGGWDLLDEWRPLTAGGMRVVLMNGDNQALNGIDDMEALGVVDHMFKPFELQQLLAARQMALDKPA